MFESYRDYELKTSVSTKSYHIIFPLNTFQRTLKKSVETLICCLLYRHTISKAVRFCLLLYCVVWLYHLLGLVYKYKSLVSTWLLCV